jgi:hypothetical protein
VERWATFDCYGTLVDWNRRNGEAECDAVIARI